MGNSKKNETSNELVIKSNKLIEANYRLSLGEQRVVFALCSSINKDDKDFEDYVFKVSDFLELLEIKDQSKYSEIPKLCRNLMKKVLTIEDGKEVLVISWLSSARYVKGKGEVILRFDPNLKPYLLLLKSEFTKLSTKDFFKLRSCHSQRIYELLKQYEKVGERTITIEQLRKKLGFKDSEYERYNDFKRKILIHSQKELEQKTGITFNFEELKQSKKVVAIKFIIKSSLISQPQESEDECYECKENELLELINKFMVKYSAKLDKELTTKLIKEKGLKHIKKCIDKYGDVLKGRSVKNVAGDFYTYVMRGYKEKRGLPKPQNMSNFEQREYDDNDNKLFTNLQDILP